MLNTVCRGAASAAAAALVLATMPATLTAQEECEFDPSDSASAASEAMQNLEEATAADSAAAFAEAWAALEDDLESDNPVVFLMAAQVRMGLDDFGEAVRMLDRFDELSSPECMVHGENQRYNGWVRLYNRGVNAYNGGETDGAIESFLLANDLRPDMRTYDMAATLQAQSGDTEGAIETYRTALATEMPETDAEQMRKAVSSLGQLLLAAGQSDEAGELYGNYLADAPDDVEILIGYAGVLADQGRTDESGAIYAETLGRDDLTYEQWLEVGVQLYNAQSFEDATTAFGNAREANPYNKEAMENYVNSSVQAGRPGPVIALADTLTTWYPYDQLAYQLKAQALGRADMNEQAMEVMAEEQTLPIIFSFAQMAAAGGGRYVVQISFTAPSASGTLEFPFEFLDASGQVVMTETRAVDSGAGTLTFDVMSDVPLSGFRYGTTGD